ncbi:MAG: tripartite tricarboxylate transporter substrate binding protein [Betaproteobacteria bacterium]|nr:tripartite tricarboxylate transporter substrate binding protein [Betaproteobacteria bacterium]
MRNAGLALLACCFASPALSQAYPSKPIRIILGAPAGGVADIRARYYAQKLTESLGQPIVVENKAGASGALAAQAVARAAPDGYTLLWGTINDLSLVPAMGLASGYDARKDFAAISLATAGYPAMVAWPGLGATTVGELVAAARKEPGKLNFASAGTATHQHFVTAFFAKQAGVRFTLVPYKGSALAYGDLMSGQVQAILGYPTEFNQYAKLGRLKVLAILGPRRIPLLPEVPTISEAGYPGLEVYGWQGFFAPASTPAETIDRLNAAILQVGSSAELRKILEDTASDFIPMAPREFAEFHRKDLERWTKIVKESGVKIE